MIYVQILLAIVSLFIFYKIVKKTKLRKYFSVDKTITITYDCLLNGTAVENNNPITER